MHIKRCLVSLYSFKLLKKNRENILLKVPLSEAKQFQKYGEGKYNFMFHMVNNVN